MTKQQEEHYISVENWEPWIQTVSGVKFHFGSSHSEEVCITDIALALSRTPRWAGHTSKLYTVGQHSIAVANLVKERNGNLTDQQIGFCHDFTEAYLCDVPAPVKTLLPEYRNLEDRLWQKISRKFFGRPVEISPLVRYCDEIMLSTEARDLFPFEPLNNWVKRCPPPHPVRIIPYSQKKVHKMFMEKYNELFSTN